jgi:3-hydroxyacyl-CoA dehydrogenase/3-hydroxy-2-methylbutyryl-CoA dehydrogenase
MLSSLFLSDKNSVNVAINCAGIAIAQKTLRANRDIPGEWNAHSLDDFTKSLMVNTVGSFNVARLAAQRMATRDPDVDGLRGCIVNTASIAAMDGQKGQVAYATSKAALVGMTLPMARDLSSVGVRVMTIVSVLLLQ